MSEIDSWWEKNGLSVKAPSSGTALQVLPSVLGTLQSQLQANRAPDPTLGTPFASRSPSSDWSTVAQMGPGQPATPFPLGGEPRQWVYRVGWNFPTPPDSDRKIDGKLLRELADMTFLVRRAIEIRKTEVCALAWDIVPSAEALSDPKFGAKQRERGRNIRNKYGETIREIREFFKYPEGYYTTFDNVNWVRKGKVAWKDWLNAFLEDYFVGDWVTIWPEKTLGGKLLSLCRVDGEHTKVLLNLDGRLPPPPMPAYQQYLYGVPRANFTLDDLYFWPRNLRNITPYGFSHVEQMLILMLLLLRYDQWNLAMYNESTLPMGILETAPGTPAPLIQDVADLINNAAGVASGRMKMIPAPSGSKWQSIKPFTYDKDFCNYIIDLVCAGMDVTRQELGFSPSNQNGLGGTGHAEAQDALNKRKGTVPLARWIEEKLNTVIRDHWGTSDIEFRFTDLIADELNDKYDANDKAIRSGQVSLDEIIEDLGGEGVGMGHIIETKAGVFLPEMNAVLTPMGLISLETGQPIGGVPGNTPPPATGDAQQDAFNQRVHQQLKSAQSDPKDDHKKELIAAYLALHPSSHPDDAPATRVDTAGTPHDAGYISDDIEVFTKQFETWIEEKIQHALASPTVNSAQARNAFTLTTADAQELTQMLNGIRAKAYQDALDTLPPEQFHESILSVTQAAQRLLDGSQNHAYEIVNTWNSDLNRAADQIEAQGIHNDQLMKLLAGWGLARAKWKGKQIGITESTDAQSQASGDWSANRPGQSVGKMRWVSKMDEKTCPECRKRNGRIVDPSLEAPPRHPNCRCVLVPVGVRGGE